MKVADTASACRGKAILDVHQRRARPHEPALQGFAIDGSKIGELEVSAMIRGREFAPAKRSINCRKFRLRSTTKFQRHGAYIRRAIPRHLRLEADHRKSESACESHAVHHAHRLAGGRGRVLDR